MKTIVIVVGLLILLGIIGAGVYFWGHTFMYTEGISETQVNTYQNAIDGANNVQEKVNNSNKKAVDKLNQIQNSAPSTY